MFDISHKARLFLAAAWLLVGLLAIGEWLVDRPSIQIEWQTETEFESAGFNLLRGEAASGPYLQLNERLIPASNDAAAGADYSFIDGDVVAGQQYYYQLEDVDFTGGATRHAPISIVAPSRPHWLLAAGLISALAGLMLAFFARTRARQGQVT
jgi:hypothetical protein